MNFTLVEKISLKKHIKRLFCNHTYRPITTIHGDSIIYLNWNRTIWKCCFCSKYKLTKNYINKKDILYCKKFLKQLERN